MSKVYDTFLEKRQRTIVEYDVGLVKCVAVDRRKMGDDEISELV